ncbi:MAG: cytochrome b/b6 domain-containing protein [Desulfobacterales bacterium]|nr:MAG: cytochrome b/b6 domain-containing protein [Desulfobacterales bacterium]
MKTDKRYFVRLNYAERAQHFIFLGCFVVLVITGFMLKLPEDIVVKTFGGARDTVFFYRSLLHRIAGTMMIAVSVFHVFYLVFRPAGRRWLMDMLPRPRDLRDMVFNMLYYIGVKDEPPAYDRFNYKQKLEYYALISGTTLMSITGLLLWTEYRWSKFVLDIGILVHGMEAILACLAIMIWHLYEIHLRPHKFPIDNMWITGLIDEEEMKAEYPLHYHKIMEDPKLRKIYIRGEDQDLTPPRTVSIADLARIH